MSEQNGCKNPVKYIRESVFGETQSVFGKRFGVDQSAVSYWERKGSFPAKFQTRVREEAVREGRDWDDAWFFSVPEAA